VSPVREQNRCTLSPPTEGLLISVEERWRPASRAVLVVLLSRGAIHFVDNQGSLSAIVRGACSDEGSASMVHDLVVRHARTRTCPWFEYVPSAANISDRVWL
jgi:hypothetical protein